MPEVMHPSRGKPLPGSSDRDLQRANQRRRRGLGWRGVARYLPRWSRRSL
jgi:hypothetical protein